MSYKAYSNRAKKFSVRREVNSTAKPKEYKKFRNKYLRQKRSQEIKKIMEEEFL